MNIILLGAPGSGKGSTSEQLISRKGVTQLSTGDLFRKNIAEKTALGLEAQKFMNAGKYVPDEITNGMVEDYLQTNHDNLVFDGFPRTRAQAEALDKMLEKLGTKIDKVIYLHVDEEVLFDRLTGRLICPKCKRSYHKITRKPQVEWICDFDGAELVTRPDDAPDKIATRIDEYNNLTATLINFYQAHGKLVILDVNGLSVEAIYFDIEEVLN
jgi:adenylate kinase